jgi:hypothetical protein
MTTTENGHQSSSSRADLPAIPQIDLPAPAEPSAPVTPGAVTAAPLDLAAADRQLRAQRRARTFIIRADYRMKDWVTHPDGGKCTVEQAQEEAVAERTRIEGETTKGSRKHHRVARWLSRIPQLVLLFDFGLLLYFFSVITDVDWARPLSSAALVFATLLAAMVTVLSYGFLSFTGHRLRTYKNHAGAVHLGDLDAMSKAAVGVAIIVILVLAALMYNRMHTEVIYAALGVSSGSTALVIALTLAVVSAAANFLVMAIHAHDGSDQVDRLNKLSAAAHRGLTKAHRMREQAAQEAGR